MFFGLLFLIILSLFSSFYQDNKDVKSIYYYKDKYRGIGLRFNPDYTYKLRISGGWGSYCSGTWKVISLNKILLSQDLYLDSIPVFEYLKPGEEVDYQKVFDSEIELFPFLNNDTMFLSENFEVAKIREFEFRWRNYSLDKNSRSYRLNQLINIIQD